MLRERFLAADVGITGANFLVAETGTSIIVTNEGNGDLTQILPKTHIVLASIEKLVPTLEDVAQLLRVLARSATGQDMSVYTTLSTGPRRTGDVDGPERYHVVILDNGRSAMLGTSFQDMLRCIRCGACMNHCPVYQAVGGHAYGWVYPGPMGAVLTPTLIGVDKAGHLPNASTFCGRCESVCPVRIPLPKMMRHWREREFERHLTPATIRSGIGLWGFFARRPSALPACDANRRGGAWTARPLAGALQLAARKPRLDAAPRLSGAAGHDLPGALEARARRWARRMTAARDDIFSNIRRSLAVKGDERTRRQIVAERLDRAPKGVIPARGQVSGEDLVEVFRAQAEAALATVRVVDSVAEVPRAVAEFLRDHNLPATMRMGDDPRLEAMPWGETALEMSQGRSDGSDLNAVSHAFGGVAESGTAIMVSGPENPSTLNFLPDNHIVVVAAKDIAGDYERVFAKLRATYGKGRMPRTVNFITGPSRSGDIEQTLLLGAHGPRRLHLVVVKS